MDAGNGSRKEVDEYIKDAEGSSQRYPKHLCAFILGKIN